MIKEIEIVFENCEHMTIKGDITFDLLPITTEGAGIQDTVDNVKITIPKEENGVYYPFGYIQDETTKFNRLFQHQDITQIVIDENTYYPNWYEENEYAYVQSNEYQKNYKDDDGNLIITISKSNKFKPSIDTSIGLTDTQKFIIIKTLEIYRNNTIDNSLKENLTEIIDIINLSKSPVDSLDRKKIELRNEFLELLPNLN